MLRRGVAVSFVLLSVALLVACGSSAPSNANSIVLKDLHDPKLAATASPPGALSSPLAAVAAGTAGPGGGIPAGGAVQPDTYTVKAGDLMGALATQFGVSLADLEAANPNVNPNSLAIGAVLKIPHPGAPTPAVGPTAPPSSSSAAAPGASGAASQFPATGGAPSGSGTAVGTVPAGASASATRAAGAGGQYTVVAGDSACKIANSHSVSVQELADANHQSKSQITTLKPGELLTIPAPTGHRDC